MFIARNPRLLSLMGVLGFLMLLSTLGIVSARQNSVQMAYANEPALRGAFELRAGREGIVHPGEIDKGNGNDASEPWTSSQVQQPADFVKELSDPKSRKPLIICVGFEFLYRNAHISGALFHGPAAKSEGLEDLKKWAQNVPRSQPIVLYCGCCPLKQCPNIRPAFKTLYEMGFTRLKVLFLETDLATDWVQKGFPVQKGK